jgi:GNAT superfamily N-acetyltransferase
LSFVIRPARPEDAIAVLRLIRDLAEYERLLSDCENDEVKFVKTFFAPAPRAFCDVAEFKSALVGYAIWFYSYSTFTGRHGIYLEDVFVSPEHRGAGIGKGFLQRLAERCAAERLTRLEWSVLDWNEPSIRFYRSLGATPADGWTRFRMSGEALAQLAEAG